MAKWIRKRSIELLFADLVLPGCFPDAEPVLPIASGRYAERARGTGIAPGTDYGDVTLLRGAIQE